VCVTLCLLCIVVPLPPGTNPFAINNINNKGKKKVKVFRYKPDVALGVPGC
jgi:hypothetical protein